MTKRNYYIVCDNKRYPYPFTKSGAMEQAEELRQIKFRGKKAKSVRVIRG